MQTSIIQIGNSRGLIIPRNFLKYLGSNRVDIELSDNGLLLKPVKNPREGWAEAARLAADNNDTDSVWPDFFEDENHEDWTW
ncbi:MAG: AbrB/MazE/SpoVT family DNA-binding domain-containing protein [Bacteroidetes bacterium]|nr:AbrB/MazE/SpoVT family DNA-binding domain-containing protein [Bacteroidota bacterium]